MLLTSALLIGQFVTAQIESAVVHNAAHTTALYMESVFDPLTESLARERVITANNRRALDEIFTHTGLGRRIVSYKIWSPEGEVLHASDASLIGRKFPQDAGRVAAMSGDVWGSFEDHGTEEDAGERALGLPLLEIYSPLREGWSGRTVAIAEFYEANPKLKEDIFSAGLRAWAVVLATGLGLGLALYTIVAQGSRTIIAQRESLTARLGELRQLAQRNANLSARVRSAAARASAREERQLRQISADLHDGPAQYLAFAALRLDALRAIPAGRPPSAQHAPQFASQFEAKFETEFDAVQQAITHAMTETRAISRGLGLPELEGKSCAAVVEMAVQAHRNRYGEAVALEIVGAEPAPNPAPNPALRICLYRFVQEGLTNAHRHAEGLGLAVTLRQSESALQLSVSDQGQGFGAGSPQQQGLGLAGLRDRVEALGGTLSCATLPQGGACIAMDLPLKGQP